MSSEIVPRLAATAPEPELARRPVFDPQARAQYVRETLRAGIGDEPARREALRSWLAELDAAERQDTDPASLAPRFIAQVLGAVLGYALPPHGPATAWATPPARVLSTPGRPDVVLGDFRDPANPRFAAVLELEPPGTPLDAPQIGHRTPLSPVQRAFAHGRRILGVAWVLVSDLRQLRLYDVEEPHSFIAIDLRECVGDDPRSRERFREMYALLSRDAVIGRSVPTAPLAGLRTRSRARQLALRDGFYELYGQVRARLGAAIAEAAAGLSPAPTPVEVATATQRLLDRLLFLHYCEDHPSGLLPEELVAERTARAFSRASPGDHAVYDELKRLFREIALGRLETAARPLAAYAGELFAPDPILDAIELPDALHLVAFRARVDGRTRTVHGVWGLHAFDFRTELDEHLLGYVFERSLGDLNALLSAGPANRETASPRKQHGVYYTSETLAEHLTGSALRAVLAESAPPRAPTTTAEIATALGERRTALERLRVIDLACGSGAFLVSAYQAVRDERDAVEDGLRLLGETVPIGQRLPTSEVPAVAQAQALRDTVFGVDLLPQAVEIAKLALGLRSARQGEQGPDLSGNVVAANSLRVADWLPQLGGRSGSFDLVVGNPPWGAELDPDARREVVQHLGISGDPDWDSWELFLLLGIDLLRDGGRLALVLPDTLFSEEKARTRELLLRETSIELCHALGVQWFAGVRMGTAVLQARKGAATPSSRFKGLLLAGPRRKSAIRGDVLLSQYEARYALEIPQQRCADDPRHALEIFRSDDDDRIIRQMDASAISLASVCDRGRGEEVNKAGLLWVCPACTATTVPAAKKKLDPRDPTRSRYRAKTCPACGARLSEHDAGQEWLVTERGDAVNAGKRTVDYYTGDDLQRRYLRLRPRQELNLEGRDFKYKDAKHFAGPKILIRQAGVGLSATIDPSDAHFPQSMYAYRVTSERRREGYSLEYVLGVLLSRTIAYYQFKRFGQVDPDAPHAKVTHERLADFPVPRVDRDDADQVARVRRIEAGVRALLDGTAPLGGEDDLLIDLHVQALFGLAPDDGLVITEALVDLPPGQAMSALFPNGRPASVGAAADPASA